MNTAAESFVAEETALNGFEWFEVECMRLMEEHGDFEQGIRGDEWRIIEQLREAEEAGANVQALHAIGYGACPQVPD